MEFQIRLKPGISSVLCVSPVYYLQAGGTSSLVRSMDYLYTAWGCWQEAAHRALRKQVEATKPN